MDNNTTGLARHLDRVDQRDPIELILSKLPNAKQNGSGWVSSCPAHADKTPSLSIGAGDDGRCLIRCHTGCTFEAIVEALGLKPADLMPSNGSRQKEPRRSPKIHATREAAIAQAEKTFEGRFARSLDYHDADGNVMVTMLRIEQGSGKKSYMPMRPVDGGFILKRPDGVLLPYRVADLPHDKSQRIFVGEGEVVAEAGQAIGLKIVTSAFGSKAAAKTDWIRVAGYTEVAILIDSDDAGRQYGEEVAAILKRLNPNIIIKIILLPNLSHGEDLVQFIEHHDDLGDEDLRRRIESLAAETPEWESGEQAAAVEDQTLISHNSSL